MDAVEIKAMIAKAKREDISFAFGRGKTKQDIFLQFDRRKKPDALFRALKAENKITKGTWGTLAIDGNLAEFAPEKPLAGLARDLRNLFKREKIAIKVTVTGEEDEEEDEGEDEELGGTHEEGRREPDAAPSAPAGIDQAAASLLEPARLSEYQKALRGWIVTRERVSSDIGKLRQQILDDYRDDPDIEAIAASTKELDRALAGMSVGIDETVRELIGAPSAIDARKFMKETQVKIGDFERFVSSDPLIQQLDSNPFVPVTIQKSMLNALKHLRQIFA